MFYTDDVERSLIDYLNGNMLTAIEKDAKKMADAELSAIEGDMDEETLTSVFNSLFRKFGHNLFPLVPALWPNFIRRGDESFPLYLSDRRFSVHTLDLRIGGTLTLAGSRQIGKSLGLGVRHNLLPRLIPGYRILYVVPFEEHRATYATRLRALEKAFALYTEHSGYRNNLHFKEYPNGSYLELVKALTSADQTRGKSADELAYDEYQLFDPDLEPEIDQTLKSSDIKFRIYAGTGTTIHSPLASRYSESSQGFYLYRCGCGKDLEMHDAETCISMIAEHGLRCPYCYRAVNIRNAFIVHRNARVLSEGHKGIHIPQIAIPEYTEDPLQWRDIYRDFVRYDRAKFLQEVLGIPTQEGARELTQADLEAICMPGVTSASLKEMAIKNKSPYKLVVSGCDWGGSDYNRAARTKQSNTLHAILGFHRNGFVDIIHFRRYSGMGYEEIAGQIIDEHCRYNGQVIASDFGVGQLYNHLLRKSGKIPVDQHIVFDYSGSATSKIVFPSNSDFYNMLMLNRTESISQLFTAIKSDPPRIRCFEWGEASGYLMEFLNLYRIQDESASTGARRWRYQRHGARPDDALHAVNFAYVAGRLACGEPLLEDPGVARILAERLRLPVASVSVNPLSAAYGKIPDAISG